MDIPPPFYVAVRADDDGDAQRRKRAALSLFRLKRERRDVSLILKIPRVFNLFFLTTEQTSFQYARINRRTAFSASVPTGRGASDSARQR